MLSFFPRDVLDKILNLVESVSEGFLPTLACLTVKACLHFLCLFVLPPYAEKHPHDCKVCRCKNSNVLYSRASTGIKLLWNVIYALKKQKKKLYVCF